MEGAGATSILVGCATLSERQATTRALRSLGDRDWKGGSGGKRERVKIKTSIFLYLFTFISIDLLFLLVICCFI